MRIETNVGKSILKIANDLQSADMMASQMVAFLGPVLRSSGQDISDKEIQKLIWSAGIADGLRVIAEVIAFILTGGDDEGNGEEAATE